MLIQRNVSAYQYPIDLSEQQLVGLSCMLGFENKVFAAACCLMPAAGLGAGCRQCGGGRDGAMCVAVSRLSSAGCRRHC